MKLKNFNIIICTIFASLLAGCAANILHPEAAHVLVSADKPEKKCKYKGMVTANQGNYFTGGFTSNANMQEGAFNELRNKAHALGGNYVQTIMQQASMTGSGSAAVWGNNVGLSSGGVRQTNVAITGNVYYCPENVR